MHSDIVKTIKNKIGGRWIVTVESCTGGLIGAAITAEPGTSAFFHGGFITYANDAKIALGVDKALIEKHGAVSREVALDMARAGKGNADFCIAVTGIAGPDGWTSAKPVGTVWIAINNDARKFHFEGNRNAVRSQSVQTALEWLVTLL